MATNPYYTHSTGKPTASSRGLSSEVRAELDSIANGLDGVQSAIAAAQSYAGAPAFDGTTAYTSGFVVYSTVDKQLYRRNSDGTSATDPSADSTNWTRVVIGLTNVHVTTTTVTAVTGNNYLLEGAACAVTAPSGVDGARFKVTPSNGLATNTILFGAATVRGPGGTLTGTVTLDSGMPMDVMYSTTISQWVMQ